MYLLKQPLASSHPLSLAPMPCLQNSRRQAWERLYLASRNLCPVFQVMPGSFNSCREQHWAVEMHSTVRLHPTLRKLPLRPFHAAHSHHNSASLASDMCSEQESRVQGTLEKG